MRTTSSFLRLLAPLALGLLLVAGCKVKDVTFTEGTGSADDAAVDDAPPDVPTGPPGFLVDMSSTTVTEGQTRTFTVALTNAPTEAMLVNLSVANDTKLGVSPTALLFSGANWQVPQTITLTGKADTDTVDEVVALTLVSTAIAQPYNVDITVDDDDGLALALSTTSLDVGEGATGNVGVSLTAQPAADVTVMVMSANTAMATVSQSALTFTPQNWASVQSLTVTGIQDLDTTDATTMLSFSSPDLTAVTLPVKVTDDDVLGISPSSTAVALTEGGNTTFTVVLTQQPAATVTVTLTSGNAGVATVAPSSIMFTTASWNVPQIITVTAQPDDDVASGSTSITLAATGVSSRTVSVTVTDDDTQAIQTTPASPATVAVTEGSTGTLNVRLAYKPAADVTVSVSSLMPGVATVAPPALTFSPTNYATNQPVTISAQQDPDAAAGAATVRLESAALGLTRDVGVTITDDDTLGIELSTATVAVTEGMTTTFNVRLTAQPATTTTVSIASNDTTAATATTSLSFTATNWSTFQAVTVTGVQDADLVGETVVFTASGGSMANQTVTATVTDNDTQVILASPAAVNVTEGSTTSLGVSLGFQPAANVTVNIASLNTAVATSSGSALTFTPANYATVQNVTITGVQDADTAAATTMVTLMATGIPTTNVAINVTDDDALNIDLTPTTLAIGEAGAGTLSVRLTALPPADTMVAIATSDAGAASVSTTALTFTTANWMTYQTVTVTGVDDADVANESVTITASSTGLTPRTATVAVTDNDTLAITRSAASVAVTEGGTGSFTVQLSALPGGTVTVAVASTDTSAITTTQSSLTFTTANWNVPQTVNLTGVQDVDLVGETVTINLTAAGATANSVTVNVTDNDTQAIQVSTTSVAITEGGATTVNVTLAFQPAGTVTVNVASANTAVAGVAPATLSFDGTSYNVAKQITISGAEDANAVTNTTTINLTLAGATSAAVTTTVADNDTLGIDLATTSLSIGEAGSGTIGVRLTAQPAAATTVTITSSDTGAATVTSSLSFTTTNWMTYQLATVTGVNDADVGNENVTITFASPPLTARTAAVIVADDEVQALVVNTGSLAVPEGAGNERTFKVRLQGQPTSDVTVNVASALPSLATVSPATLTFTAANFNVDQLVTVTGVVDADYDVEDTTVTVSATGLASKVVAIRVSEPYIVEVYQEGPSDICRYGSSYFYVRLRGDPLGTLTLNITATGSVSASPFNLAFDSGNWSVYQYVDVVPNASFGGGTTTVEGLDVVSETLSWSVYFVKYPEDCNVISRR